jgi:predicted nucleic acid-binding protein
LQPLVTPQTHEEPYFFGKVYIPSAVFQEVVTQNTVMGQKRRIKIAVEDFIEIIDPTMKHPFNRVLGIGEQEALNLAIESKADFIILDDKKAINEADDIGIKWVLTSKILKLAEREGLIPSYLEINQKLKVFNLFLPE